MIPNGPYSPIDGKSSKGGSTEYQLFPKEYFSGSDVKIYFGNQLVDEITSLEFQISEPVMPIYGYASYTPDAWARGSRIVNGSFSINFKEAYYLYSLMNASEYAFKTESMKISSAIMSNNINDVNEITKNINSSQQFEELANKYQAAIWGESLDTNMTTYIANKPYDTNFFPNDRQPNLHANGFNIVIVYGTAQKNPATIYNNNELVSSTIKVINGVQLMGATQQINGNGIAIQETYNFLASDIDYNPGVLYKK
jgi:hypothetical protein